MSLEPMRAALGRWGDPIYKLALLMTGSADGAARAAETAFRRALAASPDDLELALYTALAGASARRRFVPLRSSLLPRSVARIGQRDRLLLGLWLIARQSGARLAAVFGISGDELVARLDRLLDADDSEPQPAPHLTRSAWLRRGLFGDDEAAAHLILCAACRDQIAGWQADADALATRLRAVAADAHLPRASVDALGAEPAAPPGPPRRWAYALPLGVVLLLAAIVAPRPRQPAAQTAASLTPAELVAAALAGWEAPPAAGTLHRRVRAAPLWEEDQALMLDVWQSATGRHRWEVHRGNKLVEWQLADGRATLRYGGEPEHASCRWSIGNRSRMVSLREGGLLFAASPEQQQEALAGRLREGAYGTGYALLQRAQAAPDLRSLGERQTPEGRVTVLRFTDRLAEPARDIVLEIDAEQDLRAAQTLAGDEQTAPRDLWRVLVDEAVDDVSLAVPGGSMSPTREPLVDPACPALDSETVLPARELAFVPGPALLPTRLPDRASAAIFSQYGAEGSAPSLGRAGNATLVITRPGSRLALQLPVNGSGWGVRAPEPPGDAKTIERGRWRLVLEREPNGSFTGRVQPRDPSQDWSPWYQLRLSGWSQQELATFVEGLMHFDVLDVAAYEARFWSLSPLPEAVRSALYGAIDAERPANGSVRRSDVEIETRVDGAGATGYELADPYSSAMMFTTPSRFRLRRTSGVDQSGSAFGRFESLLPDGTLTTLYAADDSRMIWYDSRTRRAQRGPAPPDAGRWLGRPTQLDLLTALLGMGEHTLASTGESLVVERRWPFDTSAGLFHPNSIVPSPSTAGLWAGTLVARLTLRGDDHSVTALELLHRAEDGGETLLQRAVVSNDEQLPAQKGEVLALPPLDDDVAVIEYRQDGSPRMVVARDDGWIERTFQWPADVAPVVQDSVPDAPPSTIAFEQLPSASWQRFDASQLWRVTDYRFEAAGSTVTLAQGPAALLGLILRNSNGFVSTPSVVMPMWTRSEALPVTIDGRERQAWMLEGDNKAVLVVEVDELLLHFSVPVDAGAATPAVSPSDLLRGPVREALARLVRGPPGPPGPPVPPVPRLKPGAEETKPAEAG